ncbi:MAG: T9SS type A sorting domain-containing protein [Bacteroidales bacterium]|jgi:hypothetical protein|nr:T9SS type A sorting domain-containing protein [Bacteroidales bacterium]
MKSFQKKRQHFQYLLARITGILLCLFSLISYGQFTSNDIRVMNETNSFYAFPWAGGMNSMQFGAIDMNMDGIKDLIAFEREGNRKLCFINEGIPNTIDYTFQPGYAALLPELYDWAIFADYNMDGKNDIFTYSPGYASMIVYQNISDKSLKFKRMVYPYLTSYQGGGHVNIYVTYADYPGISDVDNDGDLDILTFWGLGSFVEMHKNMSMEKYGIPDSLDFEQVTYCWGHFAESDESNELYLDTCLISNKDGKDVRDDLRHTGSTFLLLDLDGDDDKDLLLGDVDYPGLFALINGGSIEEAHITSVDTLFPSVSETIKLFSMPAAAYIDVNNDAKNDLIVSPFDPSITASEDKQSVLLYLNEGENNHPDFEFYMDNFLQSEMMDQGSGAYPVLFDWDDDGLIDLFMGNYGAFQYSYYENYFLRSVYRSRLTYYKNIGTLENPAFQLTDNNFGGLWLENLLGIYPALADLNGDGNTDLLIGNEKGNLLYIQNEDNGFALMDNNYFDIDIGEFSTPQLFDLDKDGKTDLLIGEKGGNINYYRNTGTNSQPDFEFITDSLGKINVTDPMISLHGYSTPWFFRSNQNETQLIVGSEQGQIFYFTNIDGNLEGKFTLSEDLNNLLDTTGVSFDRGMRTAAAIADISQNGAFEMIVGNYSGGLEYFNGSADVSPGFNENLAGGNIIIYPNPAGLSITIKSDGPEIKSISVFDMTGQLLFQKNLVSANIQRYSVDVSQFKKGVYMVQCETKKGRINKKLIIR